MTARKALACIWLAAISLGVALLWGEALSGPAVGTFDQITVRRINVVEPDGKPRMIVSDRAEFPGLFWGGREYRHHNRDTGGFLFFNDDGDEDGGMTFSNRREGGHYTAESGIDFDQFKQDQTVGLDYAEQDGVRAAGLKVWDRPDQSLFPVIELSDQAAHASTDAEKAAIRQKMKDLVVSYGHFGQRLFAGKEGHDAVVRLADGQGRPRLVMRVGPFGEASVDFLDGGGKVVKHITGT
ncbi:MAG: hypothetical protein ACR2F8_03180 [Caulobacteraceae bacterium]